MQQDDAIKQEAMDQNSAWDYNAEIKTILSKLGINDTTKR